MSHPERLPRTVPQDPQAVEDERAVRAAFKREHDARIERRLREEVERFRPDLEELARND